MYIGKIWLDYKSQHEEAHYAAIVSRFIKREDELVLEFCGSDEGHRFFGDCVLKRVGDLYEGVGKFGYVDDFEIFSHVSVKMYEDGLDIFLDGTWWDHGDVAAYKLEAELSENGSEHLQATTSCQP